MDAGVADAAPSDAGPATFCPSGSSTSHSGIDPSKNVVEMTQADWNQFCQWELSRFAPRNCGGIIYQPYDDCETRLPLLSEPDVDCLVPVCELEQCFIDRYAMCSSANCAGIDSCALRTQ